MLLTGSLLAVLEEESDDVSFLVSSGGQSSECVTKSTYIKRETGERSDCETFIGGLRGAWGSPR